MKFPDKFKYGWWIFLMIIFGITLYVRRGAIFSGTPTSFDVVLIVIITVLLLLPYFSEISMFGITFRKQLDEAKSEIKQEVKDQIYLLRNEVQNNNNVSPNFYMGNNQIPDSLLTILEEKIRPILDSFKKDPGITSQPQSLKQLVPPEYTVLSFSSRYQLEKEIPRIWMSKLNKTIDKRRRTSIWQMTEELINAEILPPNLGYTLREVYSITSPVIHGEEPTQERINFLEDVVPSLVSALRTIA